MITGVRLSGDTVFATGLRGTGDFTSPCQPGVLAFDRATGAALWRAVLPAHQTQSCGYGAPVIAGTRVIISGEHGAVTAIDRRTGNVVWQWLHAGTNALLGGFPNPVVAGDLVVAEGRDGQLYGIGAADGRERWQAATPANGVTPLALANNRVYHVSGGGLAVFDVTTGRRLSTMSAVVGGVPAQTTPPQFREGFSAPLIVDGVVYLGASFGAWSFRAP